MSNEKGLAEEATPQGQAKSDTIAFFIILSEKQEVSNEHTLRIKLRIQ